MGANIVFLCNGKACGEYGCPNPKCKHTSNIHYAINFKEIAPDKFMEIEPPENSVIVDNMYYRITDF